MKRLFILLVALLPLGLFAQNLKLGYVDFNSCLTALPEMSDFEKKITTISEKYSKEFQTMQEDYNKKVEDFTKNQEDMTDNIKNRRIQEIQEMEDRIRLFINSSEEDVEKERNSLLQPMYEKVEKAIKEVGEENKFSGIVLQQTFLYTGNDMVDATPLVKKKLGIQ